MAFDGLLITEIFHSLQGETSLSGIPFVFVRLTGCNLRCTYCDSAYSFKGGKRMDFESILAQIRKTGAKHVLLTGGEPLLQRGTLPFLKLLRQEGYAVSIETHGEVSIEAASPFARIIMDIKTPGSGMSRGGFEQNLKFLKPEDEIKFVITSKSDYEWARDLVRNGRLPTREILFSPAVKALGSPGTFEGLPARSLAELILQDKLAVRFQIQLHKYLWGPDTKGV
ncbi:MAG: radical SAM protein [Bdellovibrionales bacterium]|nr:radical SAM protein [Bdellovibrionales bacterium]